MKKIIVTLLFGIMFLISGCSTTLKPSVKEPETDPLVLLNCPDLQSIDSSKELNMGDLVLIIVDISNQYYLCKQSALKNYKPSEK